MMTPLFLALMAAVVTADTFIHADDEAVIVEDLMMKNSLPGENSEAFIMENDNKNMLRTYNGRYSTLLQRAIRMKKKKPSKSRIVNGVASLKNEFPFMVGIFRRGSHPFCGGSLIDDRHVLTAAHCVYNIKSTEGLKVVLGENDFRNLSKTNHTERKLKRIISHKGFDFTHLDNDVAILTLDEAVEMSSAIKTIELASEENTFEGSMVTVAGWGLLKESGAMTSVQQKVAVKVWENTDCAHAYKSSSKITNNMICASWRNGTTNYDACSGDSGGPLFASTHIKRNDEAVIVSRNEPVSMDNAVGFKQLGIVSWGTGCAREEYPGVYTRVSAMKPWIENIARKY